MKAFKIFIIVFLWLGFKGLHAQIITGLDHFHNQIFVGAGYTESFNNVTYGINHTRYFKRLKRDIGGILDFSSPLSGKYYTRFIFRKGFQVDLYKKNDFRLPFAMITSSVKKTLSLFSFHDIITEFYVLPGIYKKKYTIAAEVSLKVLWFHKSHTNQNVSHSVTVPEVPYLVKHRVNLSAGFVYGYTLSHFSFIAKGGYTHVSDLEFTRAPFYAIGAISYNFNFKKEK